MNFLTNVQTEIYQKGDVIFSEGDEVNGHMYFIISGEIEILKKDVDGKPRVINSLKKNEFFGEIALLISQPRTATVQVISDNAKIAKLDQKAIIEEFSSNSAFILTLCQPTVIRKAKMLAALKALKIKPVSNNKANLMLWQQLRSHNIEIENFLTKTHSVMKPKGYVVYREHGPGDNMLYFLRDGQVDLSYEVNGESYVYETLESGEMFGLTSFIENPDRLEKSEVISKDARYYFVEKDLFLRNMKLAPKYFFNLFRYLLLQFINLESLYLKTKASKEE